MKKVTSFITLLFLTATGIFAQDSTSGTTNSSGANRWNDPAYTKRNRATYDSLLRIHRGYWNEDSGYYIRSSGDTIRPYGRTEWMRDSANFESRNWDSTYPGRDRWGIESGMGNDQSGTSGTGNMGTGAQSGNTGSGTSGNQTGTSGTGTTDSTGNQVGATGNQSGTTGTGSQQDSTSNQSGTTSGNMGNQSTSNNANNQSGQTTDRKTSTTSGTSNISTIISSSSKNMNDRVYMKGNQLMVSRNGKSTKVLESIKLKDGTVVLADGTIQLPDGNTMKLKTGESISLNQNSNKTNSSSSSQDNQ